MIKHVLLLALGLSALVGGLAIADETPEPQACPSVTNQRVVKIAGQAAGYPAECALPVCRVMNYVAMKTHLEGLQGLPGGYITVVDWRYQVKLGAVPGNACPADVVAGPWKAP